MVMLGEVNKHWWDEKSENECVIRMYAYSVLVGATMQIVANHNQ